MTQTATNTADDGYAIRSLLGRSTKRGRAARGLLSVSKVLKNLDRNLARVFTPWMLRHPKYLRAFVRLARSYKRSERLRSEHRDAGLLVPPFLIMSITPKCNLRCTGCYAAAAGTLDGGCTKTRTPLEPEGWEAIVAEGRELGVFGYIIAGGEPFLYPHLLDLVEAFDDRLFVIFTNGTAITDHDIQRLRRLPNAAVVVSLEGGRELTDARRGAGVYRRATRTLKALCASGVLAGVSATITQKNHQYWSDRATVDELVGRGVRLAFLIEYIPTEPNEGTPEDECGGNCAGLSDALVIANGVAAHNAAPRSLTVTERERFRASVLEHRDATQLYIIHSPGDEEFFGGCVSAGRGFAHITPTGDLTPCPVTNIATHNLTTSSLSDALASPLFTTIRHREELLETDGGPCALFAHPEEVDALAAKVGAYRSGGAAEDAR